MYFPVHLYAPSGASLVLTVLSHTSPRHMVETQVNPNSAPVEASGGFQASGTLGVLDFFISTRTPSHSTDRDAHFAQIDREVQLSIVTAFLFQHRAALR